MQLAPATVIAAPNRVIIAANPRRCRLAHVDCRAIGRSPARKNLHVDVLTDLAVVVQAAQQAHRAGTLRALVAAGGDGTVAELVNRTDPGLPISVFPLGTANLLAGYLGIRPDIPTFCHTIAGGRTIQLDAGQANGRIFLLMVGCGFDGEVVDRLHRVRTGHISMWSYLKPTLASIRSYEYPELRVYCDTAHDDSAHGDSAHGDSAHGDSGHCETCARR